MKQKRKRGRKNHAVTILQIGFIVFGMELFILGNETVSNLGFFITTFTFLTAITTNEDFNPSCVDRGDNGQKAS